MEEHMSHRVTCIGPCRRSTASKEKFLMNVNLYCMCGCNLMVCNDCVLNAHNIDWNKYIQIFPNPMRNPQEHLLIKVGQPHVPRGLDQSQRGLDPRGLDQNQRGIRSQQPRPPVGLRKNDKIHPQFDAGTSSMPLRNPHYGDMSNPPAQMPNILQQRGIATSFGEGQQHIEHIEPQPYFNESSGTQITPEMDESESLMNYRGSNNSKYKVYR